MEEGMRWWFESRVYWRRSVVEGRDGPNVSLRHSAEGLGRLTERVPNFGRMLCARIYQRLLLMSALSGQ